MPKRSNHNKSMYRSKQLMARCRAAAATEIVTTAVRRVNIVDFKSPIARRELPGVSLLPHVRLMRGSEIVYEASGPEDELLGEIERRTRSEKLERIR